MSKLLSIFVYFVIFIIRFDGTTTTIIDEFDSTTTIIDEFYENESTDRIDEFDSTTIVPFIEAESPMRSTSIREDSNADDNEPKTTTDQSFIIDI